MLIPGKPLHNETQRHVDRMSVHDDDHIEDLDILIRQLHQQYLWDLLTVLCVAGPDGDDSLLDLKGYQDSVAVGCSRFCCGPGVHYHGHQVHRYAVHSGLRPLRSQHCDGMLCPQWVARRGRLDGHSRRLL